jgi:hypothetical protein
MAARGCGWLPVAEEFEFLESRADAVAAGMEATGDGCWGWSLIPGREEVGFMDGDGGAAAFGEAAVGGEVADSGVVVQLAGCAEGAEVAADGGFGGAEFAAELAQGERPAAAVAFPPEPQLERVDGEGRAASAGAGHPRFFLARRQRWRVRWTAVGVRRPWRPVKTGVGSPQMRRSESQARR